MLVEMKITSIILIKKEKKIQKEFAAILNSKKIYIYVKFKKKCLQKN